ncbi:hypothetical protein [Bacillus cereus group sp. TH260-2LC]|uniref:hypothetical protein n=1 Tax=unclassified Bacillus cereus group TaxID=2750818 RepID=UPI0022E1B111|nr:hypothetical protein [Bacillus cereus group sp. TH260-2LC]
MYKSTNKNQLEIPQNDSTIVLTIPPFIIRRSNSVVKLEATANVVFKNETGGYIAPVTMELLRTGNIIAYTSAFFDLRISNFFEFTLMNLE